MRSETHLALAIEPTTVRIIVRTLPVTFGYVDVVTPLTKPVQPVMVSRFLLLSHLKRFFLYGAHARPSQRSPAPLALRQIERVWLPGCRWRQSINSWQRSHVPVPDRRLAVADDRSLVVGLGIAKPLELTGLLCANCAHILKPLPQPVTTPVLRQLTFGR